MWFWNPLISQKVLLWSPPSFYGVNLGLVLEVSWYCEMCFLLCELSPFHVTSSCQRFQQIPLAFATVASVASLEHSYTVCKTNIFVYLYYPIMMYCLMYVEIYVFSLWLPQLLPQWSTIWATSPPTCWYTLHPDDICNVQKSCSSIDVILMFASKTLRKDSYSPRVHSCTPPKSNIDTKNDGLENVSPFKHGYFGYLC